MIEIRNLVKYFDDFKALNEATLTVKDGVVYGLVGPNGAGKSTLIRHLTGIYKPDSGSVLVEGQQIYENTYKKSIMAAIPDDWFYFQSANIKDMANFYSGFYHSFNMKRYEELKDIFKIPEKLTIRRMSKGMQKQVAFWIAICCCPKYLILDEPVDGLDPVMRRQIWNILLSDVHNNGTTVLVSSHNLRELEDVCTNVGIMHNGKVLLERTLDDIQDSIIKLRILWNNNEDINDQVEMPADINVLNSSQDGKLMTYIIKGKADEVKERLKEYNPLFVEVIPLNLEETFIYELGEEEYAVKEIIL